MKANFEKIHSYYRGLDLDTHAAEIMACGKKESFKSGDKITVDEGYIHFITEGSVSISLQGDTLVIGNTIEYMPVGLMEKYCPVIQFDYTCMSAVTLVTVTHDDFHRIFSSNEKNRDELITILVYMTIFSLDLHVERKSDTCYQTIKPMLHRYLYRRQTHKNENEGLASFIISRTNLSRTHVFRVLAELKEGEYITIDKGKLISINKDLPEKY